MILIKWKCAQLSILLNPFLETLDCFSKPCHTFYSHHHGVSHLKGQNVCLYADGQFFDFLHFLLLIVQANRWFQKSLTLFVGSRVRRAGQKTLNLLPSQKAIELECKLVSSLQIPIPVPNLRVESANVRDQGFQLTPKFARRGLKVCLREPAIIPVYGKISASAAPSSGVEPARGLAGADSRRIPLKICYACVPSSFCRISSQPACDTGGYSR